MYLYHYFEKEKGPFLTVTDLPTDDAVNILSGIKDQPDIQYLIKRRETEAYIKKLFIKKGGNPTRESPHYFTVEKTDYINSWFVNPAHIKIFITEFKMDTVSFTFGDSFMIFNNSGDGLEYRNDVYLYKDILNLIDKYGYPQNAEYIPDMPLNTLFKYIEAHVWSDDIPMKYREKWFSNKT